jgi:hypothetical protein
MTPRRPNALSRLAIVTAAMAIFVLTGCATPNRRVDSSFRSPTPISDLPLKKICFAVCFPLEKSSEYGVLVLTGSGHKVMRTDPPPRFKSTESENAIIEHQYRSPDVHPDGSRVAYVHEIILYLQQGPQEEFRHWFGRLTEWHDDHPDEAELKVAEVRTGAEHVVHEPPRAIFVASPVWSPSGDRLAFLEGKDLAILDGSTYQEVDRVKGVLARAVSRFGHNRLRWGQDGDTLYLDAMDDCQRVNEQASCSGIGKIDLSTHALTWLGAEGFRKERAELRPVVNIQCGTSFFQGDNLGTVQLPDTVAVYSLFGPPNICRDGIWSPGRRFYFTRNGSQGFFSSDWIEGYDLQTGRIFRVRTLDRQFYSE